MKVRMKFEKNIKYISHLDLMKAMQKILTRTGLPVKYSEGFNPHIILSIANPIPVGVVGLCEFADFELNDELDKNYILNKLILASPEGIKPIDLYFNCNKSFNLAQIATFDIAIISNESEKIIDFLNKDEIFVEKKAKGKIKTINLKEYIYECNIEKTIIGLDIKLCCACGNTKNLNPLLIKKAILTNNINLDDFSVKRTGVFDGNMDDFLI
jgi:radical SAM-linked protein